MARIDIKSAGGASLDTGILQLENGVAMDATLRKVADQNNTTSPLLLSTALVQTTSTLKITTADNPYIDAEDNSGNNRFTIGRDPASQIVNVDFASNPTGSTSQVGAIRTYQDGTNLSDVVKFREDGQVTFTERVNVEADSLVTTQSSSVIAASTTNANLVIAPNGSGALIADIPDGTATGGNARGSYAVDLQMNRNAATNVASGIISVISGGESNTASGARSVIAGGQSNSAWGNQSYVGGGGSNLSADNYCVVSGGQSNTASTSHATVVGGQSNVSSGQHSVSGGQSNTASGLQSVALGFSNIASSQGSVALGYGNNATGYNSFVIGRSSTASSFYSGALGYLSNATAQNSYAIGQQTNASASNSIAFMGGSSTAQGSVSFQGGLSQAESSYSIGGASYGYLLGMNAFSNGNFGGPLKTIQHSFVLARKEAVLNASGTTILSLDGTGTTNLLIPTNGDSGPRRFWNVTVEYVAFCLAVGSGTTVLNEMAIGTDKFLFKRPLGVSTIGTITNIQQSSEASMVGASCTYAVGASQDLQITFVAPPTANGTTFRIAAKVSLVELS
jgi:hypothetical protein